MAVCSICFFLMIRRPPRSTLIARRQRQMCIRDSGGDGLVIARQLAVSGYWVEVFVPGSRSGMTEECGCLLYTSPSPRDRTRSRMPSSA